MNNRQWMRKCARYLKSVEWPQKEPGLKKLIASLAVPLLSVVWGCVPAGSTSWILTNVTVVNVAEGTLVPAQALEIVGGRVGRIRPSEERHRTGVQVIDGAGAYVLPGLFDMHAHVVGVGPDPLPVDLSRYTDVGVLGLRDLGAPADTIAAFRARTPSMPAPRVWFSGPILDTPARDFGHLFGRVSEPGEAPTAVRLVAENGWLSVKVSDWMSRDVYDALVSEARARGLPVVGHVPHDVTLDAVVESGQRSIEHLGGLTHGILRACSEQPPGTLPGLQSLVELERYKTAMSPEFLIPLLDGFSRTKCEAVVQKLAETATWQVPNLTLWKFWAETPPPDFVEGTEDRITLQRLYETLAGIVALMNRAGVPIMTGVDEIPGATVHDEMRLLVAAGLTPGEALRAGTIAPARFLGATDSLGSIRSGTVADFVLIDGDPLADIGNTERLRAVVINGTFYDVGPGGLARRPTDSR
jgi:imidazolonepropionase-like amidohydrolase